MIRLLPLAVGLSIVTAIAAQQDLPRAAITAVVLSPEGAPVSSGTAALVTSPTNRITANIGRDGRFRVVPDNAGRQLLVISVAGFAPYRAMVDVPRSRAMALPDIQLLQATYYRVRLVSPDGEPIGLGIRWFSLDADDETITDSLQHTSQQIDAEGTASIGPLPLGRTMFAFDRAPFAQTRLRDAIVNGTQPFIEGGTFTIRPASRLQVDIVDAKGVAVKEHLVWIEDAIQPSPLRFFQPVKTDDAGHALFDRLAPGRYRVWTRMDDRCRNRFLSITRLVQTSSGGLAHTRMVIDGQAAVRITTPVGPLLGRSVSMAPDAPDQAPWQPQMPGMRRVILTQMTARCDGVTNSDGQVKLAPFPPGPTQLSVELFNSKYFSRVEIPENGGEITLAIPDGLIPVKVLVGGSKKPMPEAKVIWDGNGGHVEATTTANGDALLEAVGAGSGRITVSANGYQTLEGSFSEAPETLQEVMLTALRPDRITITVTAEDGGAVPNAVVELQTTRPGDPIKFAATENGRVTFSQLPPGVVHMRIHAEGFIDATARVDAEISAVNVSLKRAQ